MPLRTHLPHIYLPATLERTDFTPVTRNLGEGEPLTARQNRYLHANKLTAELDTAVQQREEGIVRSGTDNKGNVMWSIRAFHRS